jgi:hypothetical protein
MSVRERQLAALLAGHIAKPRARAFLVALDLVAELVIGV